jgi:pimeloyl-ACP methyl ester carboxylesterase
MNGKHFLLSNGVKLAYQRFGSGNARKAICFHGWLDNSNTYAQLGPSLANEGYESTCIDFLGHGLSSHADPASNNHFSQLVIHAKEVFDQIQQEQINSKPDCENKNDCKINVIGHSMGGSVALLFAAAYPEAVDRLVLLESWGPLSRPASDAAAILRRGIDGKIAYNTKQETAPYNKVYDYEAAIDARVNTVKHYPGSQYISREAAKYLVDRGSEKIPDQSGKVRFRHDQQLYLPSLTYFTPDQIASFFDALKSKVLLVTGTHGWPVYPSASQAEANKKLLEDKGLLTHIHLDGSHHLHLDPDSAPSVSQHVVNFLKS